MAKPQNLTDRVQVVDPETGYPTTFLMGLLQGRGKLVERLQLDVHRLKEALEELNELIEALETQQTLPQRVRWGRIWGDIEDQTDLQEEFASLEHALCGGI